jgi:hypothetical protein
LCQNHANKIRSIWSYLRKICINHTYFPAKKYLPSRWLQRRISARLMFSCDLSQAIRLLQVADDAGISGRELQSTRWIRAPMTTRFLAYCIINCLKKMEVDYKLSALLPRYMTWSTAPIWHMSDTDLGSVGLWSTPDTPGGTSN